MGVPVPGWYPTGNSRGSRRKHHYFHVSEERLVSLCRSAPTILRNVRRKSARWFIMDRPDLFCRHCVISLKSMGHWD